MPNDVSDARSNPNEQIEHAARVIGKSLQRRKVFEAIYRGKKQSKRVSEITTATGLPRMRVLQEGKHLVNNHVVRQHKLDGETAYEKDNFYHVNKSVILRLVADKKKLEAYPTKRKLRFVGTPSVEVKLNLELAKARAISIDDIEEFAPVRDVASGPLLREMSERQFKEGIQRILHQQGKFNDWGGEKNDLQAIVHLGGKRKHAAFAFKGPGIKAAVLTPAKLGKNGDQIQRLFQSPAQVYFVQYCKGIAESVREQMQQLAVAASVMRSEEIWYGVIDGQDSERLVVAFPSEFKLRKKEGGL